MSDNIRNFCIIAHIDHGKSTLADRLLEHTGTVTRREMKEQLLDDLELERQRGITIKARAVAMTFTRGGQTYELNLIDTPGHVDFQYEVSRSLACCEGALLLVDAFQGVEAQTVANAYAAMDHDLQIIPVINKIDLTHARPDEVAEEMMNSLGTDPDECVRVSAKTGAGVDSLVDAIIEHIPPPTGDSKQSCKPWSSTPTTMIIVERSPMYESCRARSAKARRSDFYVPEHSTKLSNSAVLCRIEKHVNH